MIVMGPQYDSLSGLWSLSLSGGLIQGMHHAVRSGIQGISHRPLVWALTFFKGIRTFLYCCASKGPEKPNTTYSIPYTIYHIPYIYTMYHILYTIPPFKGALFRGARHFTLSMAVSSSHLPGAIAFQWSMDKEECLALEIFPRRANSA